MKLVVWLNVLTEHQVHTFTSLEQYLSEPILYVLSVEELVERKEQGWKAVRKKSLRVVILPKKGWFSFAKNIQKKEKDAIHLFGGLWSDKRFFPLILTAQKKGISTALMMEPYIDKSQSYFAIKPNFIDRSKSFVRPFLYKFLGKLSIKRFSAIFAISEKSISQMRKMGASENKIFPFGYFVPKDNGFNAIAKLKYKSIRLVFVGSIIERKGLKTLLKAVELVCDRGLQVSLDIYGPGNPAGIDSELDNISYRGVIPFGDAQKIIGLYDLLVLPSLHDGWGVVVNEALLQGVPALVSQECGVKTLIKSSGAGAIFPAKDACELARLIQLVVDEPSLLTAWSLAASDYREQLFPNVAGEYLYDCFRYTEKKLSQKPMAPWYLTSGKNHVY